MGRPLGGEQGGDLVLEGVELGDLVPELVVHALDLLLLPLLGLSGLLRRRLHLVHLGRQPLVFTL